MFIDMDNDIKIAGDKPSEDVRKNRQKSIENARSSREKIESAKSAGAAVARRFIEDALSGDDEDFRDYDLLIQRRQLLSFTATVGFEKYIADESLCKVAQNNFLDTIRNHSGELYKSSSDTGSFSFYYLAFRRGCDIERRVGQTFAMLCSHDGDPIFQELGEALYCWFLSVVRKAVLEYLK